jgi:NADH dehydrogenase/NADH:ubiquinone oxidoreductase subunit G
LISGAAGNEELLAFRDLMAKGFSAGSVASLDAELLRAVSAAETKGSGEPLKEASWTTIPEADFIVLLGAELYRTQPMLSSLIRRSIIERGVKVAVIGEMACMPPFTAFSFPLDREKLTPLIKALRMEVTDRLKGGPKKRKTVARGAEGDVRALLKDAGLSAAEKKSFYDMADACARSVKPLFMVGEGVTGLKSPSAFQDALKLARAKGTDSNDGVPLVTLKPFGNSAGARKIGLIMTGKPGRAKGGLVVLSHGGDLDSPALQSLGEPDFLAVISPYFPENLAEKANVLIPKPLWLEENGSFTSVDGRDVAYKPKVLDPPEGVKPSWEVLTALAEHAGFRHRLPTWEDLRGKAEKTIKGRGRRR